ncbi:MAG: hypothetical protein ACK53Y_28240, partial [bacterium]
GNTLMDQHALHGHYQIFVFLMPLPPAFEISLSALPRQYCIYREARPGTNRTDQNKMSQTNDRS